MSGDQPFPILTPDLTKAINALSGADDNQLTLLVGEPGVGKSFALETAAARSPLARATARGRRHLSPLQLVELLLTDITGEPASEIGIDDLTRLLAGDDCARLLAVTEQLIAVLSEDLGLITIDDAHLLPPETLTWLHDLVDVPEIHVALAGEPSLTAKLPIKLCHEASAIRLAPLNPRLVPEVIRHYHPVWVGTHPDTIQMIDERYAHGYFARWAEATEYAIEICNFDEPSFVTGRIACDLLDQLERSDAAA